MKSMGLKYLLLAIVSVTLFMGCAQESKVSPGTIPNTGEGENPVSVNTDTTNKSTAGSNVVDLTIVGGSASDKIYNFAKYTGRSLYDPQNIKLSVSLTDRGGESYGGTLRVSYTDNGVSRTGTFVNGESSYYLKYKNAKESAQFNKWFVSNGQWVFHGFFQDNAGAVILVLDGSSDILLGDGQLPSKFKGSLWYKNFDSLVLYQYGTGPHPYMHCWFVEGPYDCRAWSTDGNINTFKSVYPDSGYIKLGTFTNLDITKAFN